jgi:hypothetical protein
MNRVYIIDLGLAVKFNEDGCEDGSPRKELTVVGNRCYASLNSHMLIQQSQRDDLESLAYLLIDLVTGTLPWKKSLFFRGSTTPQCKIRKMKQQLSPEVLCWGLPSCFTTFLKTAKALKFREVPDYSYLKGLFESTFTELNFSRDPELFMN